MDISLAEISFRHAKNDDFLLIQEWFVKPHVCEYFDDPETGRSIPDLKKFLSGDDSFWQHWVGCYAGRPFMYLMTSEVQPDEKGIWGKWPAPHGQTYTLDLFIGEEEFLGKGLAHEYILMFIHTKFTHANAFLIDPEIANKRAIHIYEKVGFKKVDDYSPDDGQFAGVPHILMRLEMK